MLGEVLPLLDLGDPQIQIHRGAEANRGAGGFGAEAPVGSVERGGLPLVIGASSIAAGEAGGRPGAERGAGEGTGRRGCDLRLAFWAAGWLE